MKFAETSYFFSKYMHLWGWATWRRAWKLYDDSMAAWPAFSKDKLFLNLADTRFFLPEWRYIFNRNKYDGATAESWDYKFMLSCWAHSGFSIIPSISLTSNIGFGANAEHCLNPNDPAANHPTGELQFPLRHPVIIERNKVFDKYEDIWDRGCSWKSYIRLLCQKHPILAKIINIARHIKTM